MRRALLVGINHYESAPLTGCIEDATRMERLLRRHDDGRVNFDTHTILPQGRITREVDLRNVMAILPGRSPRRLPAG